VSPTSRSSSRNAAPAKPKAWPPRWLTPVPPADLRRGDGKLFTDFAEGVCRVTKDSVAAPAGSLLKFRPWQKQLNRHVLARRADGRYRHRQALIGIARKNAKSTSGSTLGLGGLILGPEGGEVYSCAADKEQARIIFGTARRMVELDPELDELLKCYRDAIEFQKTGSVDRALSAEAYTKEGLNPHLVLFDEVHAQPNRELWDVMALAMGARLEPLMVGITTAGVKTDSTGQDSLCYSMYQYGVRVARGEIVDPAFFMAWWEPRNPHADHRLEATWREGNPGFDDLVSAEDFASAVLRTPEAEFRTKRCNQWVSAAQSFMPAGAWDSRARVGVEIEPHEKVVLSFDGSKSGDSTGLTATSVSTPHHIQTVAVWEHPPDEKDWRVPRQDVKDAILTACKTWEVVEIPWDPFLWLDMAEELTEMGLPVEEFPQTPERMGRATQRLYEATLAGELTHDGNRAMARHIENAVLKVDNRGWRIVKEKPNSKRWIDLAVCAAMGLDRAAWWAANDDEGVILW
jgi:phage terminase large subunit-like protein